MISVLLTQNPVVRDAIASALSLEKKESETISVYKKGKWVLIFSNQLSLSELSQFAGENYAPDFAYLPYFGHSIDVVHEIGDIILPNTFLTMNARLIESEVDEKNRDAFLEDAKFLESYTLQKDYFVEDYGLSVGGIVVADTSPTLLTEAPEKLMTAYEADVYIGETLTDAYELVKNSPIPTTILCGIIEGKDSQHRKTEPMMHAIGNMVTTIRLLEDDEME